LYPALAAAKELEMKEGEDMKRFLLFGLLLFSTLSACSGNGEQLVGSAISYINVIDKGEIEQQSYWILAVYPGSTAPTEIKILVDNKSIWNLVEINKEYTAEYNTYSNGEHRLVEISPLD
jgi:hypothetical protein